MENIETYDPWVRRAFIAGISCLSDDERCPWFKNKTLFRRDYLDQIVEKWVMKNHFLWCHKYFKAIDSWDQVLFHIA